MKILSRTAFLDMPEGTIYCSGEKYNGLCTHFYGPQRKGETLRFDGGGDWYETTYDSIEHSDYDEWIERLELMHQEGASFAMERSICREGLFDDNRVYLVFERDDLLALRGDIDEALRILKEADV